MKIQIHKLRKDAKLPYKKHEEDAGYDLSWSPKDASEYHGGWFKGNELQEMKIIKPGESVLLGTGLRVIFPHGYAMEIKNRSGMAAKKSLLVGACVIDSTYRGEVFVNLHNVSNENQFIQPGERIAQFVVYKVESCSFEEITEKEYSENETLRSDGGFGSTGQK